MNYFDATKDMGKKSSDWYVPPDIAIHFFPLVTCLVVLIVSRVLISLQLGDVSTLFFWALGLAGLGIVLLFFARLPLYRKGQFWTVGPRELGRLHRRLYWLAYLIILAGLGLFGIVWLRAG